ncbi:LacI family DNA-binding transcriptional regulator [Inquilinus limosus]|uniref:LacI family DNA-binding transcriptional regulator n=1 Tax=Inquilinus limosus TaxID=171674 RepID=UPI001930A134
MATIRDVARAAGVSTATVSAVVNDSAYVSPALRAGCSPPSASCNTRRPRWPGTSSAAQAS